jgi:hypothetical protein
MANGKWKRGNWAEGAKWESAIGVGPARIEERQSVMRDA